MKTDLNVACYRNYACTRTNRNAYLAMSSFKTLYWANKKNTGPNSFGTQTASFANSSQRHKMSEHSLLFLQLLEAKRLQNMPVGIPTAYIPVVTGWSLFLLLPHVTGADIYTDPHLTDYKKRTVLSWISLVLLSTYQKYSFVRNNTHRQDPERYLSRHCTRNVECLSLDIAIPATSYLSELSCFGSYGIVFRR